MKFFVTFNMPHTGLDEWLKLPAEERTKQEGEMKAAWDAWQAQHANVVSELVGVGKPKRVTASGTSDERNDMMMYALVEASSLDEAAALFEGHPHFGIPGSWIEVMPTKLAA